ncbi:pentapeptide repeat-containing protein [Spongorhabdus nitratireducens]
MSKPIENHAEYDSEAFNDIDLSNSRLTDIEFDACTFINCDLSETVFEKCRFIDCLFDKCNLSLARLDHSRLLEVSFRNSKLIGIDWTRVDWPQILPAAPVSFHSCILNDACFFGLSLSELIMEDCKAHDVDFREGAFVKAVLNGTDLTNSLFNNTDLSAASFIEAANYNIDINFNNVKGASFSRYEATRLLESLGIELVD